MSECRTQDLDDYIAFDTHFSKSIVEVPFSLSLVLGELTGALGLLVILDETVAWASFAVVLLFTAGQCALSTPPAASPAPHLHPPRHLTLLGIRSPRQSA